MNNDVTHGEPPRHAARWAWWPGALSLLLVVVSGTLYTGMYLTTPEGVLPGYAEPTRGTLHWFFFRSWGVMDVAREQSVPAWYSSVLWAVFALAAFVMAAMTRLRRVSWVLLGLVGLAASADETVALHERLGSVGDRMAEALGIEVQFAWAIPGAVLALGVVALLWRLVWSLPRTARALLIAGGAVFLLGALVLETISGQIMLRFDGVVTWHQHLVTHFEELCEMLGLSLAIAGILRLVLVGREGPASWRVALEPAVA